jgi:hypothetical protein
MGATNAEADVMWKARGGSGKRKGRTAENVEQVCLMLSRSEREFLEETGWKLRLNPSDVIRLALRSLFDGETNSLELCKAGEVKDGVKSEKVGFKVSKAEKTFLDAAGKERGVSVGKLVRLSLRSLAESLQGGQD